MKRCPKCHRFGVETDTCTGIERCVWRSCGFINKDNIDLSKINHPFKFKKFLDAITRKTRI